MQWLVRPSPAARLASGGSQRGIGRAELFAPVAWPYVLAPPRHMECRQSFRGEPAYTRRCERHGHYAADWRLGQAETGLTVGPRNARSLTDALRVHHSAPGFGVGATCRSFSVNPLARRTKPKRAAGSLAISVLREADRAFWTRTA
jgi:hypothetical protein